MSSKLAGSLLILRRSFSKSLTSPGRQVYIEYCPSCSPTRKFRQVEHEIKAHFPQVTVIPNPVAPRKGAFEVTDEHGNIIWSKLREHKHPACGEIADVIKKRGILADLPHPKPGKQPSV